MRLAELTRAATGQVELVTALPADVDDPDVQTRNTHCPEVAELLIARTANEVFGSQSLDRDELELANFIFNKLDVDPHYIPSNTLLQAIRSLNKKLDAGRALQNVNRIA